MDSRRTLLYFLWYLECSGCSFLRSGDRTLHKQRNFLAVVCFNMAPASDGGFTHDSLGNLYLERLVSFLSFVKLPCVTCVHYFFILFFFLMLTQIFSPFALPVCAALLLRAKYMSFLLSWAMLSGRSPACDTCLWWGRLPWRCSRGTSSVCTKTSEKVCILACFVSSDAVASNLGSRSLKIFNPRTRWNHRIKVAVITPFIGERLGTTHSTSRRHTEISPPTLFVMRRGCEFQPPSTCITPVYI